MLDCGAELSSQEAATAALLKWGYFTDNQRFVKAPVSGQMKGQTPQGRNCCFFFSFFFWCSVHNPHLHPPPPLHLSFSLFRSGCARSPCRHLVSHELALGWVSAECFLFSSLHSFSLHSFTLYMFCLVVYLHLSTMPSFYPPPHDLPFFLFFIPHKFFIRVLPSCLSSSFLPLLLHSAFSPLTLSVHLSVIPAIFVLSVKKNRGSALVIVKSNKEAHKTIIPGMCTNLSRKPAAYRKLPSRDSFNCLVNTSYSLHWQHIYKQCQARLNGLLLLCLR